ncbi:uncharacterized protein BO95DRAFT_516358 [Aspergillus brunneoviolaceus CBS 621.78]|uniref:Uncharacterized protein n=1 Tax=Aspergillus brunneoviolaceus CBS 621.78 TaxID=1450534 RepID=A0ACD1G2N0_9EURO|nr:hypothetical protein BO95DRAFT_516358 [Aspergillus brunneoviolaceus CBS 621.78]RAH43528.1 hypothetical protein BO95DRAFT_516358 [Aspergillus brunneoviolaceus CBS 621.78]
MKAIHLWVATALMVPRALAATATSTTSTSTSSTAAASCTASLITTLCSYPEPGDDFAVASESTANCWDYCNAHPPCSFVIFAAGNPTTGTGTCWLYPGQSYNASEGSSDCSSPYLSVYDEPVCSGGSATTTTAGACAATATPTAVASGCGYPAPSDCFDDCVTSTGAPDCLSLCAEADSCSYVVFNPENADNSTYAAGNCWIYPNGTYDAGSATTCSGDPEQYVYNNVCPKASSSSSALSSSATSTGTVATTTGSTGTEIADQTAASSTSSENSASAGLSHTSPLAIGMAMVVLQAFW